MVKKNQPRDEYARASHPSYILTFRYIPISVYHLGGKWWGKVGESGVSVKGL